MKEHLGKSAGIHLGVQGLRRQLGARLSPTPLSLMLFVLLGCARHGMTREDGGLPPGVGGFRWFAESAPIIKESVSGERGGCFVREKAIWGSAVVHTSICLFIIIIIIRMYEKF